MNPKLIMSLIICNFFLCVTNIMLFNCFFKILFVCNKFGKGTCVQSYPLATALFGAPALGFTFLLEIITKKVFAIIYFCIFLSGIFRKNVVTI